MADNVQLNTNSTEGAVLATAEVTWSGDTANVQLVGLGLISGSAESYAVTVLDIGAGNVGTGTPRFTLAADDPGVVLLGTIDTDTGNIATAASAIQTAVEGTLSVQSNSENLATQTTAAAILADTANMDTNLGTIAGAINAEDDQHTSTDTGIMSLAVRNDTASALAGATGDYIPLTTDAIGNLRVAITDVSGSELDYRTEGENVNAADHGILMFGRDYASTPDKYRMLRVDDSGYAEIRVEGPTGDEYLEPNTSDFDTGGGTDNTSSFGIAFPAAGGGVICPGDATNGMTVNLGTNNDVAATLQAGSAIAGKVYITDGTEDALVNASGHLQVDIATDSVGIGGGTQYTEDAAAAADPIGNAVILVRDDAPGALVSTDGDNVAQRGTNYGAAFVQVVDSSGNFIDSFGGSGGTSSADDADFTAGTTLGTQIQGVYESSPTSVTDGDVGQIGITATRQVRTSASQEGTWNVTNISGTVSLPTGAATEATLSTIDTDTGNIATAASAIQTAVEIMDDWDDGSDHCEVVGAAAEDAAVAGAPLLAGGRYDSTERTLDNGDAGALALSPEGWMMVGNQSSYLFDGVTRCQVKRASGLAASGTTAIISAVSDKKFRILAVGLFATSATVTNVYLATTTDTDVLGNSGNPIPLATDADGDNIAGLVLPYNQGGWTETSTANEALNLVLSAAQDVVYAITYIEVA